MVAFCRLEKKLHLAEDEIEQFQAGLGKVLKASRKKDESGGGGKYGDDDDDEPPQKLDLKGIQELMESLEAIKDELRASKEARIKLEGELSAMKDKLEKKIWAMNDLEEELGTANGKIEKLQAAKKRLEDFNEKLKNENQKKQQVIVDRNKEILQLKQIIAKMKAKMNQNNTASSTKIQTLESELTRMRGELKDLQEKMKKTLDWVKNQASKPHIIASHGLAFYNWRHKARFEMCIAPKHQRSWVQNTPRIQNKYHY